MQRCWRFLPVVIAVWSCGASLAYAAVKAEDATKAAILAGEIDGFGAFCKKESRMRETLFTRLEREKSSVLDLEDLRNQALGGYEGAVSALEQEKPDCQGLEFLMKKVEKVKAMKDLSVHMFGAGGNGQSLQGEKP